MQQGGSLVDGELPVAGDLEVVMAKELRRQYAKRERADAVILFLESSGIGQRINFAAQVRGGSPGSRVGGGVLPAPEAVAEGPESPQRPRKKGYASYGDYAAYKSSDFGGKSFSKKLKY
jgi:hypothetical protein